MTQNVTEKTSLNSGSAAAGDESIPVDGSARRLTPAAARALAEAQARQADIDRRSREQPRELHGRKGPDPARYGDWEVKGIASDF